MTSQEPQNSVSRNDYFIRREYTHLVHFGRQKRLNAKEREMYADCIYIVGEHDDLRLDILTGRYEATDYWLSHPRAG